MSRPADLLLRLGDTQPIVPTAGQISFYAKTNGVFYSLDSNGVETPIGGGGGGSGTVTSVSIIANPSRITATGNPITTSGSITLDLATTAVTAGSYTNASFTVDAYGRITAASNGTAGGVTSFNTRTGDITLTEADITEALGYTPTSNPGTVTSVNASGGATGLTFNGGPVVGNGVLTLAGTLSLANGGTGGTTQPQAANAILPPQTGNAGKVLVTDGTNVSWATSGTGAGTVTSVAATGSTDITVNGSPITSSGTLSFALANTTVTAGTYGSATQVPVFTVDAKGRITGVTNTNITGGGTVTSVSVAGGTTGLTFTGSPITTSGTITMSGTLAIANGGTGQTTANAAFNALAPSQTGNAGRFLTTNGTTTSWATVSGTGTVTSVGVTTTPTRITVSGSPVTTSGNIALDLATTGVTAGSYTLSSITVDAYGRITSASSGSAGGTGTVTSVSGTGTVSGLTLSGTVTTSGNLTLGGTLTLTSGQVTTALGYTPYNGTTNPNGYTSNTGTVTSVATGTGLTGGPITTTGTIALANTTVTPGSYTNANITVDAQGRITSASNGSAGGGTGTVTSVAASGGTTGLSFTGSPITTSGTLTLSGTLAIANGGTGATTANAALNALLPTQTSNSGKVLTTDGTNTSWTTVSGGSSAPEQVVFHYSSGGSGTLNIADAIYSQTAGVTATVTDGANSIVTFAFNGKSNPPKSVTIYGQNFASNTFAITSWPAVGSAQANFKIAGGGTASLPDLSAGLFSSSNIVTMQLRMSDTGASSTIGNRAWAIVVFGF